VAYAIDHDGQRVGRVSLYPDSAVVDLDGAVAAAPSTPEREGLAVEETGDGAVLRLSTGTAVKAAVDVVRTTLAG
jgi:predicted lipoprotein